jgi:hypothetical protein
MHSYCGCLLELLLLLFPSCGVALLIGDCAPKMLLIAACHAFYLIYLALGSRPPQLSWPPERPPPSGTDVQRPLVLTMLRLWALQWGRRRAVEEELCDVERLCCAAHPHFGGSCCIAVAALCLILGFPDQEPLHLLRGTTRGGTASHISGWSLYRRIPLGSPLTGGTLHPEGINASGAYDIRIRPWADCAVNASHAIIRPDCTLCSTAAHHAVHPCCALPL